MEKYRVWDAENKKFLNKTFSIEEIITSKFPDSFIYQRYISVKDKHGKPAFKGDIAIISYYHSNTPLKLDDKVNFNLEIIGNILENPEMANDSSQAEYFFGIEKK